MTPLRSPLSWARRVVPPVLVVIAGALTYWSMTGSWRPSSEVGLEILGAGLLMAGMQALDGWSPDPERTMRWLAAFRPLGRVIVPATVIIAGGLMSWIMTGSPRPSSEVGLEILGAGLLMAVIQGLDQRFASAEERW
jgi:hypothetical protein